MDSLTHPYRVLDGMRRQWRFSCACTRLGGERLAWEQTYEAYEYDEFSDLVLRHYREAFEARMVRGVQERWGSICGVSFGERRVQLMTRWGPIEAADTGTVLSDFVRTGRVPELADHPISPIARGFIFSIPPQRVVYNVVPPINPAPSVADNWMADELDLDEEEWRK